MGLSALRYKLSQSYCPTAEPAEKNLLACKNYEFSSKIRSSKDDAEKKRLGEERKAMYTEAGKKTDAEKKTAAAAHKKLYSAAFSKYCAGANASGDLCKNEMMTKMYGGAKAIGDLCKNEMMTKMYGG